jgi:hypothetical protein
LAAINGASSELLFSFKLFLSFWSFFLKKKKEKKEKEKRIEKYEHFHFHI